MIRILANRLRHISSSVVVCLLLTSFVGEAAAGSNSGRAAPASAARIFLPLVVKYGPGLKPLVSQCVDCPKNISVMTSHSLRLDASSLPHIAYGSDHLYHAWFNGSTWLYETVDPAPGVGYYTSLAFDNTGKPGIAYLDSFNNTLKFARWTGSAWTIQTVDGPTSSNTYPTLLFDSSNNPMLVYVADFGNFYTYQIKFARWTGSAWNIYPAVETGTSFFPSLALDKNGEPHISYFRDDYKRSGGLIYASWTGSAWSLQIVDPTNYMGKDNCLAFDNAGNPHISYYDDWDGVKYASWNGSAWVLEMIHTIVRVDEPGPTSLAFDSNDVPLVSAALGGSSIHLVWLYRRAAGGGWYQEQVGTGQYTSLAVSPDGKAHISYFDYELGALRYASLTAWAPAPPYTWTNEVLDYGGQVGQGVSAAMGPTGTPHVAYMDLTHNQLKYATLVYGQWKTSVVNVADISPTHGHSLALDPAGRPHIAYSDYANRKIMYASFDGTNWTAEEVGPDEQAGMDDIEKYVSLAIDSAGIPHISYYYQNGLNLIHASKPAGIWVLDEVDKLEVGITGTYNAIALDSLGRPHISYMDNHNNHLMYAYWNGSVWVKLTPDSTYTTGKTTAIAIDSANHPHICYSDYSGHYLKYAYYDGSSWTVETLTANTSGLPDSRQPACSIKLLNGSTPYISYFERASQHLMLARKTGGVWLTEVVDTNGDIGEHNSLALYNGTPYIAYYGRSLKDLLFMMWKP